MEKRIIELRKAKCNNRRELLTVADKPAEKRRTINEEEWNKVMTIGEEEHNRGMRNEKRRSKR